MLKGIAQYYIGTHLFTTQIEQAKCTYQGIPLRTFKNLEGHGVQWSPLLLFYRWVYTDVQAVQLSTDA